MNLYIEISQYKLNVTASKDNCFHISNKNIFTFLEETTMLSCMDDLPSIKIGDDILRFELDPLTEFGKGVAQKELRETNEIKTKAIEDLKDLLKGTLAKAQLKRKSTL